MKFREMTKALNSTIDGLFSIVRGVLPESIEFSETWSYTYTNDDHETYVVTITRKEGR